MTAYLVRIEAVNLGQVLEDTDQLSVIRGGALLALAGARALVERPVTLATSPLPQPSPGFWERLSARLGVAGVAADSGSVAVEIPAARISSGASIGLYEVVFPETAAGPTPDDYQAEVVRRLNQDYPHHTFVVDLAPIPATPDGFTQAQRLVTARNRVRQLRQLSLALPGDPRATAVTGPCAWDDLRPAAAPLPRGKGPGKRSDQVSASVAARFRHGADHKGAFIREQSGIDLEYARDFEEIATDFPDYRLRNKLAVLYFDGNGFGAIQDGCRSADQLQDFDDAIQLKRRELLAQVLRQLAADQTHAFYTRQPEPDDPSGAKAVLRFELLLWGGDEILFVVPAWKGLAALFAFYAATAGWQWPVGGKDLTHAGALIFCDYKTPIARMTALAREMAEAVKDREHGRDRNLFDYLILESIDFPAEPLEQYRAARYGPLVSCRRPLCPPREGPALIRAIAALREHPDFPRGKLYEGAQALIVHPDAKAAVWQQALADLEETLTADPDTAAVTHRLKVDLAALLPDQDPAWQWLHLIELWDYLAPRPAAGGPGGTR
ncbi:hypothetical protein [uncultured Thiodictyon sp.]|jgi:hypothetical protein|uniref:hypothetical protein n=1 Tax=uncultured Thiodictyon sp. TaxID=1846217 RepID=UPI0025EA8C8E|nr:hypothetical protein [uncultured Thiodictyon sp.]